MVMTKKERACRDMADVCELAHERTVRECRALGIEVNCNSEMKCGDSGQLHETKADTMTHYNLESQEVFDRHYENICKKTGL